MNPKTLRLFAAGIVVMTAVVCWYLLKMNPESASRTAGKVPAAEPPRVTHKPPADQTREPWEVLHVTKLGSASVERARKWLDDRGRDAAGLTALWQLTGDEALLTEAAKNFPDDPGVCRAMIHHTRTDAKKALPWIERLVAADPRAPEGFYLKAWALMTGGDRAGALAVLGKAANMCGIADGHRQKDYQILSEAALASGASNRDAPLLALRASQQYSPVQIAVEGMTAAVRAEIAAAEPASSEERLLVVAGVGFTAASNLTTLAGLSMKNELDATSLELEIFAELAGDTEFGDGGRTASALMHEAENRRKHIVKTLAEASAAGDFLLQADDGSVSTYASCFMTHGEHSATGFALSQRPPPKEEGGPGP